MNLPVKIYSVKISYGVIEIACDDVTAINEQHAKERCAEQIIERLKLPRSLLQYKLLMAHAKVTEVISRHE